MCEKGNSWMWALILSGSAVAGSSTPGSPDALPLWSGRRGFQGQSVMWLWVKNGCPKWNPGKWNQGLKPAVFVVVKILTHTHVAMGHVGHVVMGQWIVCTAEAGGQHLTSLGSATICLTMATLLAGG